MATQGIVTLMEYGEVMAKIVVGCDGCNAGRVADAIIHYAQWDADDEPWRQNAKLLYSLAEKAGFGCKDCRMVITLETIYYQFAKGNPWHDTEVVLARARRTLTDATFNPRWEVGTADYVVTVQA